MSHFSAKTTIAALLAVSAIAGPTASAQPIDRPGLGVPAASQAQAYSADMSSQPGFSTTDSDSGGFDWGDAAIGGGAIVVLGLAGAGLVAVRRGREHRHALLSN